MIFKFGDFQFDCDQNILTRNGEVLQLNEKPALILSLMLKNADKIHSKSELFEAVWPDRVVTEQVIFQNISYLRAKFGDDSIKTFSKKGYQWQLAITLVNQDEELNEFANSNEQSPPSKGFKIDPVSFLTFFIIFISCIAFVWIELNKPTHHQEQITDGSSNVRLFVADKNGQVKMMTPRSAELKLSTQTLFDSPYATWQQHVANKEHWLVATRFYQVKDKVALRFLIQGSKRGWHDYVWADNKNSAMEKLNELIAIVTPTNYFNDALDYLALDALTELTSNYNENTLLHNQIIALHYKLDELDKAELLVDQQLDKENLNFRSGLLHLFKAQINLRNRNEMAAGESINTALAIFRELEVIHLEAKALLELSWFYLAKLNFRAGIQSLNQAAGKARMAKEPLLEVTAHLKQSFIASRAGHLELSHAQLGLAKELVKLHQLDNVHQVKVLNTARSMAGSAKEKLLYHQRILNMPFAAQYEINFYMAAKSVRHSHIKTQEWDKALATIKPWQRPSFELLTKAYVAIAQGERQKAIGYAENAFSLAQFNRYKTDALDAAVFLLQNKTIKGSAIEINAYQSFIKKNASNRWLKQNRKLLETLGVRLFVQKNY